MNLILDKNGYQPFKRTCPTDQLSEPIRYTLELELGYAVMFAEDWWDLVVNYDIKSFCDKTNTPIVTCCPYYLHLCL
jgi:hypothetical protein